MDAQDLLELGEAIAELYDQTCTISDGQTVLGSFGCLLLPAGQAGGVSGGSPDPADASASGLSSWTALLPIEAAAAAAAGNRLVSTSGLDLAITGSDAGKSFPAFTTVSLAKQETATPGSGLVLVRWDATTLSWTELPPQRVQIVTGTVRDEMGSNGTPVRVQDVTLIGPLTLNVQSGDGFAYEGGKGRVTSVARSDRTEAAATVRWL